MNLLLAFIEWVERAVQRVFAWLSVLALFNGVTTKGRHFLDSHANHLLSGELLVRAWYWLLLSSEVLGLVAYEYAQRVKTVAVRSGHTVSAFGGLTNA